MSEDLPSSVVDYIWGRNQEFHSCGGSVQALAFLPVPTIVTAVATITFGESNDGVLIVFEAVRLSDLGIAKYSYHAMYGTEQLFRYCHDPRGHPQMPTHRHAAGAEKEPWGQVSFMEAVEELWPVVVERDAEAEAEREI